MSTPSAPSAPGTTTTTPMATVVPPVVVGEPVASPAPPVASGFTDGHWSEAWTRPVSAGWLATEVLVHLDDLHEATASGGRWAVGLDASEYILKYLVLHGTRALSHRHIGAAFMFCGIVVRYTQALHRFNAAAASTRRFERALSTRPYDGDYDPDPLEVDDLHMGATAHELYARVAARELDSLQSLASRYARRIYVDVEADARRGDPMRRRFGEADYEALTVAVVAARVASAAASASSFSSGGDGNSTTSASTDGPPVVATSIDDDTCCCICQNALLMSSPDDVDVAEDADVADADVADAQLPLRRFRACAHVYHDACLRDYLMGPTGVHLPARCPMCRVDVESGRRVVCAAEAEAEYVDAWVMNGYVDDADAYGSRTAANPRMRYEMHREARTARPSSQDRPVRRYRLRRHE